jgi:hypothetical protein
LLQNFACKGCPTIIILVYHWWTHCAHTCMLCFCQQANNTIWNNNKNTVACKYCILVVNHWWAGSKILLCVSIYLLCSSCKPLHVNIVLRVSYRTTLLLIYIFGGVHSWHMMFPFHSCQTNNIWNNSNCCWENLNCCIAFYV